MMGRMFESKAVMDYSDAALPMWPVWLTVGLLAVFCCICIARIFDSGTH